MKKALTGLFLALATLSNAHAADQMSCSFEDNNGDVYEASFSRQGQLVTSTLKLNGVDMPALHACVPFVPKRHNERMGAEVRCPHGLDEIRFEVYPVFAGNKYRRPVAMKVIRWNGEQLFTTIVSTNCQ